MVGGFSWLLVPRYVYSNTIIYAIMLTLLILIVKQVNISVIPQVTLTWEQESLENYTVFISFNVKNMNLGMSREQQKGLKDVWRQGRSVLIVALSAPRH